MSDIKSLALERQVISGLLKYNKKFYDLSNLLDNTCFTNALYKALYSVISSFINESKSLDSFLIVQELNKLNIKFEIENIYEHIESLKLISVSEDSLVLLVKQLRTIKHRRELVEAGQNIINIARNASDDDSLSSIIGKTDQIYGNVINPLYSRSEDFENIYDGLYDFFLDKAKNPVDDVGLLGPFKHLNEICGSILRPGHYSVIAARSGLGKTAVMFYYATCISEHYGIPVLWLDEGEMLSNDLRGRAGASITDIPMPLLETGKFGKNPDYLKRLGLIKQKESKINILYKNISGLSPEEIISVIRRFRYKYVPRGQINKCFIVLDYFKIGINKGYKQDWILAGELVKMLKDFLSREQLSLLAALQINRSGVTTNKKSEEVNDSEEAFSLTDEILRQSSHSFIWRDLTLDEQEDDLESTNKLIPLKLRFWGERGIEFKKPVKLGKKLVKNFLRFKLENFKIQELGTFREHATKLEFKNKEKKSNKEIGGDGVEFELP